MPAEVTVSGAGQGSKGVTREMEILKDARGAGSTYRTWEHVEEPRIHLACIVQLSLLAIVLYQCLPRLRVSFRIFFDAIFQLADSVVR